MPLVMFSLVAIITGWHNMYWLLYGWLCSIRIFSKGYNKCLIHEVTGQFFVPFAKCLSFLPHPVLFDKWVCMHSVVNGHISCSSWNVGFIIFGDNGVRGAGVGLNVYHFCSQWMMTNTNLNIFASVCNSVSATMHHLWYIEFY